jgi:hypothetical protein
MIESTARPLKNVVIVRPLNDRLRELFLWHQPPHRAPFRYAAYVAVALGALALVAPGLFAVDAVMPGDGHAQRTLDIAFTHAQCGRGYAAHRSFSVSAWLRDHPELRHVPMADAIRDQIGSIHQYCENAAAAAVNNENAVGVLEWAAIALSPRISLTDLGERLQLFRIVLVAFGAFALMAAGTSVAVCIALLAASITILKRLEAAAYSTYPFLFVWIVTVVGLLSLAARADVPRRTRLVLILIAGFVSAMAANTRTSHAPAYLALLALGALAIEWTSGGRPRILPRTGAAALVAAAGFMACQLVLFGLFLRGAVGGGAARHPIAHPLVLSVALPPNPVSEREGIEWRDGVGPEIVGRIDPGVAYLSPRYGQILIRYYAGLWTKYPREMTALYVTKLRLAGSDFYEKLSRPGDGFGRPARYLLWPFAAVRNGFGVMALYVGVFALSCVSVFGWSVVGAVPVMLFTAAALCLHVELAMITPYFFLPYHNYSAFYAVFLSLAILQLMVSAGAMAWTRLGERHRHAATALTRDLIFFHPKPFVHALAYLAVVALACFVLRPAWFVVDRGVAASGDAQASLDLAIGRAVCGAPLPSSTFSVPRYVAEHPELQIVPIRSLIVDRVGSIDAYCASLTPAPIDGAGSLRLLESWMLRLRSGISVAGLAKALHWCRVGGLLLCGLFFLAAGVSVMLTFGIVLSSLGWLSSTRSDVLSAYPFLLVLALLAIASSSLAITLAIRYVPMRLRAAGSSARQA